MNQRKFFQSVIVFTLIFNTCLSSYAPLKAMEDEKEPERHPVQAQLKMDPEDEKTRIFNHLFKRQEDLNEKHLKLNGLCLKWKNDMKVYGADSVLLKSEISEFNALLKVSNDVPAKKIALNVERENLKKRREDIKSRGQKLNAQMIELESEKQRLDYKGFWLSKIFKLFLDSIKDD